MVNFFLFFRNKKIKREAWEERGTKISNSLPKKKCGETDRRDLKTFETTAGSYFIFEKWVFTHGIIAADTLYIKTWLFKNLETLYPQYLDEIWEARVHTRRHPKLLCNLQGQTISSCHSMRTFFLILQV